MEMVRDIVLSGKYEGKKVEFIENGIGIKTKFKGTINFDDTMVKEYQILWSERQQVKLFGGVLGVFAFLGLAMVGQVLEGIFDAIVSDGRGVTGWFALVFGIPGIVWGIRKSPWIGNYRIELFLRNGERSVIEVSEMLYKTLRDKVPNRQESFIRGRDDEKEYHVEEEPVAVEEDMDLLAELEAINETITDEKMSEQVDRIRDVTEKILNYQEKRPEKAALLHSFLSYYLPATLRILKTYGELEGQGVSGGNITGTMERIEGMMDQIVACFEKQLDRLYQGEAMDIAAEVQVLERMMAKDGLTGEGDFSL